MFGISGGFARGCDVRKKGVCCYGEGSLIFRTQSFPLISSYDDALQVIAYILPPFYPATREELPSSTNIHHPYHHHLNPPLLSLSLHTLP